MLQGQSFPSWSNASQKVNSKAAQAQRSLHQCSNLHNRRRRHLQQFFWRRDLGRVKYEWLEGGIEWSPDSEATAVNSSHESLRTALQRLLTSNEVLTLETKLGRLSDEHVQSLFVRVADKMIAAVEFP